MPCHLSEVFEAVLGGSLTFTLSNYHKLVQIFPNERSARIFKIFYCSLPIAYVTRTLLKRASKFDKFKRNSTRFYQELLEDYLLHATFLLPSWVFSLTCFINNCVIFFILLFINVWRYIFWETQWKCDNSTCFVLSLP